MPLTLQEKILNFGSKEKFQTFKIPEVIFPFRHHLKVCPNGERIEKKILTPEEETNKPKK
jgi:hypothetical protein